MILGRENEWNRYGFCERSRDDGARNERAVLLQKFFKVLGVEHANAEFFQFGRRPTGQALFRPARQRTEPLFNLPAEHRQFAFLYAAFDSRPKTLLSRMSLRIGILRASCSTV